MKRGVGFRLLLGFAVALIFIVANAIVSFQAADTLNSNYKRVLETQEGITKVEEVLSILKDAETGQRGFLLTGRPVFLEPYNSAVGKIDEHLTELRHKLAGDIELIEKIDELEDSIDIRMATLARSLELYGVGGIERVADEGMLELGKLQMDEIRRRVDTIRAEEQERLELRLYEVRISSRNSVVTFVAANFVVLVLFGVVYSLVRRDIAERERTARELQDAHDNLESKVAERTAELSTANVELERSNRELQDFAFVASHDLQEPLRKIQAFGDRLKTVQGPKFDDQGRDYLERMQNAAGRMHTLINDLLTYSRVTTKAQPFTETDLNIVAADVMSDLEVRIQQSGGRVEIAPLPTIDADELQMRQLFQNLIANGLKFYRAGVPPVVKVFSSDTGNGRVTITVGDNGIGFDEKYLDRIFTPFQRLHGRDEYEGTGIGLAVCRKIVERHGGSLIAESEPGKGSTFIFTLPKRQQEK